MVKTGIRLWSLGAPGPHFQSLVACTAQPRPAVQGPARGPVRAARCPRHVPSNETLKVRIMMRDESFLALESAEDACLLAKAIVDTVREPLLVLDRDLRIIVASRSFYLTFEMTRQVTQGRKIYDLDEGVWSIPELRLLLEKIVPEHGVMEGFEVERDFPRIGRRAMMLNCGEVFFYVNWLSVIFFL